MTVPNGGLSTVIGWAALGCQTGVIAGSAVAARRRREVMTVITHVKTTIDATAIIAVLRTEHPTSETSPYQRIRGGP